VLDAFVPLASHYRPLWLGFGALALDLLIALTITSLLRARLGLRAWRAVHWAAYACWPVAVLHGLGTGTDARSVWLQALTAVCVGAVVVALAARLLRDWPARAGLRVGGLGLVGVALVGAVAFAVQGPLAQGWARRAGTPVTLLAASRTPVARRAVSAATTVRLPFTGSLSGAARQFNSPADGSTQIDIAGQIDVAGRRVPLDVRLFGRPLPGGGLGMSSSSVTLGPSGQLGRYRGQVVALSGNRVEARLAASGARAVLLRLVLHIDASRAVAGTAAAQETG
jgi:hypothetical protein